MRENFLVLQQIIQRFGADSMAPTMVTIFDRMMRFITENIIDHLGKIQQMGDNFVGFFKAMANFFRGMGNWLGQFEPAANVIIDMFKAGSKANTSSLFRDLSDLVVKNREGLMAFGTAVGNLFGGIFDLFSGGNRGFFEDGLPMLIDVMIRECKPYNLQVFPRDRHGIRNKASSIHYITSVTNVLLNNLPPS